MKPYIIAIVLMGFTASGSAEPTPGFGTIDRFDGQTKATTSIGYVLPDGFLEDQTIVRTDFMGQFVAPEGYGGYVTLPIHYIAGSNDSEAGIGNLEVGGLYVLSGPVQLVFRGGLSLDTAEESALFAGVARMNDFVSGAKGWTHFRGSISPLYQRGNAFFRADLGIDRAISDSGDDFEQILRFNLGAGVRIRNVAVMGELVNWANKDSSDGNVLSLLGTTVRWLGSGPMQPHLSLQIPIDEDFGDLVNANLIIGLEYVP